MMMMMMMMVMMMMMMMIPDASVKGVDTHGKYFKSCDSVSYR